MAARGAKTKADLNEATRQELIDVAGLRPNVADAVVKHREEHGPFRNLEDLADIAGIGSATVDQLRDVAEVSANAAKEVAAKVSEQGRETAEAMRGGAERLAAVNTELGVRATATAGEMGKKASDQTVAALERTASASRDAVGGFGRMGTLWLSYWPEQIGEGVKLASELPSCRTWFDVVNLQTAFMRSSIRRLDERMRATMDLMTNVGLHGVDTARDNAPAR